MPNRPKDPKSFLKITRKTSEYRPVCERIHDNKEVISRRDDEISIEQAYRCMDCGTPFCHSGCPIGNIIPEWNRLLANENWEQAFILLDSTNILPEVTGRICPALCETACVLGLNDEPVTVRENELSIIERAFKHEIIKPKPPIFRTGKKVAVIGSGPSGISTAAFLNRKGHNVVVFEKDENLGGILRYGIPDFKLEKILLDRRIDILKAEGIEFKTNANIQNIEDLKDEFDAICLAIGSRAPRDLNVKGRDLEGIYFAMDFLIQHNKKVAGEELTEFEKTISAKDKSVVVIGGGDTGADCVGVAHREEPKCITQIEIMPEPPKERTMDMAWPKFPMILRVSSSHEEGVVRDWCVMTKEFIGENGKVKAIKCERVEFGPEKDSSGRPVMKIIEDSEFEIPADFVVLSMGFVHAEHDGLVKNLGLEIDARGNIKADEKSFSTSKKGVFVAGDARRGASLIVWAIHEGRSVADAIDEYLKKKEKKES